MRGAAPRSPRRSPAASAWRGSIFEARASWAAISRMRLDAVRRGGMFLRTHRRLELLTDRECAWSTGLRHGPPQPRKTRVHDQLPPGQRLRTENKLGLSTFDLKIQAASF